MEFIPFKKKNLSDEVKSYLYEYIKKMDIKFNTKLPSEDSIAQSLGVSRVTVRKALTDLEQEGIVFRIHGKGTFVNPEALQMNINIALGTDFEQMIINSGYKAKVEIVNFQIKFAGFNIADKLQIEDDDSIAVVEKVFYADENPAIFCIDMFPVDIIEGQITDEEIKLSVFELLRKKAGKIVSWDKIELQVLTKKQISSQYKHIDCMGNDAFLNIEAINYDHENNPVLYNLEFHDTNYIRFNTIRQKNIKFGDA